MSKNDFNSLLEISKKTACFTLILLFPLFFLTTTREFFITNKLYLLAFSALFLLLISTLQLLVSKKFFWTKRPFDNLVLLFLAALAVSIIFSSPNKVQALLNPSLGLVMMISLAILYFYISRFQSDVRVLRAKPLQIISIILSLITIVFYFQPFKNVNLPQFLAFLKNPLFTPIGSQLDLAIFLGFFVVLQIVSVLRNVSPASGGTRPKWIPVFTGMTLIINLLALFLTVYSLVKPVVQTPNLGVSTILPPFRLSWFAALEILKNPQTALIGAGLDNFSAIFTKVKDFAYNQSPLWQINSFNISRSAILQILTETGIFGLFAFGLLIFNVFRVIPSPDETRGQAPEGIQKINMDSRLHGNDKKLDIFLFFYLLICLFIFPTSLIVWFLFFILIGLISQQSNNETMKQSVDLSGLLPIYIGTVVFAFLLIVLSYYFLGCSYASEYYFKKSFDGIVVKNFKQVYGNQRQAIILNPYIEKFHGNFAQTNLLIANNLAQKDQAKKISEQDRQTITQAIQAAIAEGKAVVSLNPQRADGWENLASIYLNVINVAQGADVWTISAYQRAILSDPQNPIYRVGLGGVYYNLKKYDDALNFFGQAVSLKPDWANASYNYAWANFQKGNYPQAVNAMQNTLSLIDPKLNKTDYEKVQKELAEFKKKLPKEASPEAK